ncbi:unnamed protein product [Schistosoma curassoni]|uniref:Secreted protein n=1 Tax=Schistosoma curassoni TaxID=6186 RepID=A0A183JST5_9TREM|nr:unnamed protein product [Schistosoma curassoni]
MFFSCKYAALALPIRAFTSASDPPCSSMMLPNYVKVFTSSKSSPSIVIGLVHSVLYRRISSSKSSPSIVIGLVHAVLYRRILLFPLCILRPTAAEAVATLVVDRRAR